MKQEHHYRALENMYLAAPINKIFNPRISVACEHAEVEIEVNETLFHSAGALHGSVYFKMLDDAAFFAANSIIFDCFALTASFTTYLTRPVFAGPMRSVGQVVSKSKTQIIAESVAYDERGKQVGRGSGIFVKGKLLLKDALGYEFDEG